MQRLHHHIDGVEVFFAIKVPGQVGFTVRGRMMSLTQGTLNLIWVRINFYDDFPPAKTVNFGGAFFSSTRQCPFG